MEVTGRRCTYEVIRLATFELKPSGGRTETSECNCDVFKVMRAVADGYDTRLRLCNTAVFVLFFGDVVNDISFDVGSPRAAAVSRTYDVGLIVLPGQVVNVDVNDVVSVVNPEHWICRVPVDVVHFPALGQGCQRWQQEHEQYSHFEASCNRVVVQCFFLWVFS